MRISLMQVPWIWRALAITLAALVVSLAGAAALSLSSVEPTRFGLVVPDGPTYRIHAVLGAALNRLDRAPATAATQWLRAASHATSPAEVDRAGNGISTSRAQSGYNWAVDDRLCASYIKARPSVRSAVQAAGLACSDDPSLFTHVPAGTPIWYTSRPPMGGPHYPSWYPTYGVATEVVAPGYWVHNMEHGAVVLLYRCPTACPELVQQLSQLYSNLPPARNGVAGPRLLITAFDGMDHPLAMVAWGHKVTMDQLDPLLVREFYTRFIDRGPECNNLACPG